ncbi:NADP-dependent malic enzyme [Salipaludibacillus agaradhaerens]|uniref:NADP-dependent malic enzyme n=1 Tax=Salipaludibacillus agaradhaerens TaxID=76935 RepID=A0A9Q4AZB3_SALAG|nr:NADP-dependent malic enzyme [Salipaludibacillus agaradhaerens]MCR6095186.1 NADP-dependent malic enzyme [Salipaludibacillus agaradhaerens]MCR6115256.1 NADP-dependent malic enzyme [Salipaludibacillus agaradhaerens]
MAIGNLTDEAMLLHRKLKGKISMESKMEIDTTDDLSLVYTPGVGDVCQAIVENPNDVNELTARGNMIGVITDGSAVLGLGNIGPKAAMPVMEGKCMLFKKFANLDAFPICLDNQNTEDIITIIKSLEPSFAGINLEDISAPRCFEIEKRLKDELNIPVFHDDQHGTAIVVLAALINALKLTENSKEECKIVINGAGAAGLSIAKLLLEAGFINIILVSLEGVVCEGEPWLNNSQQEMAKQTNLQKVTGTLDDVIDNADVFIGVSGPGALNGEHVKRMGSNPIIFALANPTPEIEPEEALSAGAAVVATGRSDYPNQVNNLLVFPGIFRGALNAGASDITVEMKISAAWAIAEMVTEQELNPNYIIPDALNKLIPFTVANAVERAATYSKAISNESY